MDVFKIAELGKELGYTGEALRSFIDNEKKEVAEREKQQREREERAREREEKAKEDEHKRELEKSELWRQQKEDERRRELERKGKAMEMLRMQMTMGKDA